MRDQRDLRTFTVDITDLKPETVADINESLTRFRKERVARERDRMRVGRQPLRIPLDVEYTGVDKSGNRHVVASTTGES